MPSINLSHFEIDGTVIKLIPSEIAQKHQVIPINRTGNILTVAMADPSNIFAIDDVKFMTGFKVEPVVAAETSIKNAINKYYDSAGMVEDIMKNFDDKDVEALRDDEDGVNAAELGKAAEDAPVVKLVNLILTDAIKKAASDIHIEPYEKSFRVRYRIDGVLYDVMQPPLRLKAAITSRVKIMAQLDIAERRLPQDGRIKIKMGGREMDYRVSTLPTLFGEKVVLRLLDKGNLQLDMTKLGFGPEALTDFESGLLLPYGMVLVTGPTGSGKTTTLYSALNRLNTVDTNIMTAEDPVEFNLSGINQVQTKAEIGLTFAAALRSFLRQDPDMIMVGEIRDYETAEIGGQGRPHGTPRPVHAPHQRRAQHHQPPPEHGRGALPGRGLHQRHRGPAAGPPHLPGLQGDRSRCRRPALVNVGFSPEEAKTIKPLQGQGVHDLQRHRLQGPGGAVRSDADQGQHQGGDPARGLGHGAARVGAQERHADPARGRPAEDPRGHDHRGGGPARHHRPLTATRQPARHRTGARSRACQTCTNC